MPAATRPGGMLNPIKDCYVIVPFGSKEYLIELNNLPEISDSKTATYNDETVIGRASPLKTYAQSDNRSISFNITFFVTHSSKGENRPSPGSVEYNLDALRALQSAVYPREGANGAPFIPPPICRLKCGQLLSRSGELCVILKQYSVKFPTEVAWDEDTLLPFKFSVETTWDVVYKSSDLPGQERIFSLGR